MQNNINIWRLEDSITIQVFQEKVKQTLSSM